MTTAPQLNRRALLTGAAATFAAAAAGPALSAVPKGGFRGIFPIAFTPCKADKSVDFDGLASQVAFCRKGGVPGLAWPQIASGWSVLSEAERMQGAEVQAQAAKGGKMSLIIGVQSRTNDFAEVQRYSSHAEKVGADGLICIPPTNLDANGMFDFYMKLSKLTPMPIFIQAVGSFTPDLIVRLTESTPNIRYCKDEAGNPVKDAAEIIRRTNGQMKLFSGNGVVTMMSEMEAGFSGHCPFVSLSDLYQSAFDLFHSGKKQQAYDQFGRIQAAGSFFAQNNINSMIARGAFKPGIESINTVRAAPAAPGSVTAPTIASTPDEIKRVLDTYLKRYMRA